MHLAFSLLGQIRHPQCHFAGKQQRAHATIQFLTQGLLRILGGSGHFALAALQGQAQFPYHAGDSGNREIHADGNCRTEILEEDFRPVWLGLQQKFVENDRGEFLRTKASNRSL